MRQSEPGCRMRKMRGKMEANRTKQDQTGPNRTLVCPRKDQGMAYTKQECISNKVEHYATFIIYDYNSNLHNTLN